MAYLLVTELRSLLYPFSQEVGGDETWTVLLYSYYMAAETSVYVALPVLLASGDRQAKKSHLGFSLKLPWYRPTIQDNCAFLAADQKNWDLSES
jgi:hypothetical protein